VVRDEAWFAGIAAEYKLALIENESLRRAGRAVRELRARGEDREWLEGVS
jgi:hypothetical protein